MREGALIAALVLLAAAQQWWLPCCGLEQVSKDGRHKLEGPEQSPPRVAIIGGGIGGAFAAWKLRKELGKDLVIDV